jgi:putative RNA 2'-phosphotransferase
MDPKILKQKSKFLSLVLRHKPEKIGLSLDQQGWANTQELLEKANQGRFTLTPEELTYIVENNKKKRFAFNESGTKIRASQGHSIQIDLGYQSQEPPQTLFHGTVEKFMPSILRQGLIKGSRHHVHLSADIETATKVGSRRGKPVILIVQSKAMHEAGHEFFISQNGVWLTEQVPPEFLARKA